MKPLRLLAFIEATGVTGPAKNLLQFARMAREVDAPVETTIATFRRPGDSDVFLAEAHRSGVPVEFIAESGRFDRKVLAEMAALTRRLAPDVVQTHAVKSHLLARLAGLPKLAPWVAFHHGYTWPDLKVRMYNQLDRLSLRAARHVITVSLPFRSELEQMGVSRKRITVIHNAIDPQWGRAARAAALALRGKLGIPQGREIILIVGRLSREKDHLALLNAMPQLLRAGNFVPHLLVVGDGPERPRMEAAIVALGLKEHVTLTGQVPSAEPYYGLADAAVLSSRSEGSPNALLEAMAAGVPVVATAVGGIPEIVTHQKSALLIPPGNSERLADALSTLFNNRALAHSLAASASIVVEQEHAPGTRVGQLCEIYRSLV